MKHNWKKDENGNVNEWAWESGFHNGVICMNCGRSVCVHCEPDYLELDDCTGPEPEIDAATALLITREQVENVWKGEWIGMTDDDGCIWYECSRCEHDLDSLEDPNHFCPACGAPMTDEAVDMVMERLEEMKDGSTTN